MSYALGALKGIQEISYEWDADSDKIDELRTHIGEGSMQALQYTQQEGLIGEDSLEELSHLGHFSLLAEGRVEEDVADEIDELDLHDVLLVQNHLAQHSEDILGDVVYELFAEDWVIDVV